MTSTLRYARGKEVSAVTFNIKEQKFLEKTMQTIDIERNYSLKLLELNHRIVRVNHKKLKDRVSKIQSHLNVDEIQELRDKEASGDLKLSSNCLNLGSARKIASAAKRLHLSDSIRRPSSHALPRVPPETAVLLFRPHSVSGAFMNAPTTSRHRHRHPTHLKTNTDPGVNDSISSKNSDESSEDVADNAIHILRPHTTVGSTRTRSDHLPGLSTVPVQFTTQSSTQSHNQTNSGFSSHNTLSRAPSRTQSFCRASGTIDESVESNLGDDMYEERRQDLLRIQEAHSVILEKRKDDFIKDVDSYIEEIKLARRKKIPQFLERTYSENESDTGEHSFEKSPIPKRRVEFDGVPTHMPEFEYAQRLESLWNGMTKCRYLRIPDEVLDLSGIKTLAKDQFQLHSLWKNNAPVN